MQIERPVGDVCGAANGTGHDAGTHAPQAAEERRRRCACWGTPQRVCWGLVTVGGVFTVGAARAHFLWYESQCESVSIESAFRFSPFSLSLNVTVHPESGGGGGALILVGEMQLYFPRTVSLNRVIWYKYAGNLLPGLGG